MARRTYTEEQVVAKIAILKNKAGGVRALAKQLGLSPSYVSDMLKGNRAPGQDLLRALGLRKEVVVRYVEDKS